MENPSLQQHINIGEDIIIKEEYLEEDEIGVGLLMEENVMNTSEKAIKREDDYRINILSDIKPLENWLPKQELSLVSEINSSEDIPSPLTEFKSDNSNKQNTKASAPRKSTQNNVKRFACSECTYLCKSKSALCGHMLSVHSEINPFKCSDCNCSYKKKGGLTYHIRSVHKQERPFKCSKCVHSSCSNSTLLNHVISVHKNKKPFMCNECNYSSFDIGKLNNHILDFHLKGKIFKCHICDKSYDKKCKLLTHIRIIHQGKYMF